MQRYHHKIDNNIIRGSEYCLILDCIDYAWKNSQIYDEEYENLLLYLDKNTPKRRVDNLLREEL